MTELLDGISFEDLDEYTKRLARLRANDDVQPEIEYIDGKPVAWMPNVNQQKFMDCPAFECLMHGTRGGGKTDGLLMTFAQHCERGHDSAWRGLIIRQTYKELADVVQKSKKWFPAIFEGRTVYNEQNFSWKWKTGEMLMFRHLNQLSDYEK